MYGSNEHSSERSFTTQDNSEAFYNQTVAKKKCPNTLPLFGSLDIYECAIFLSQSYLVRISFCMNIINQLMLWVILLKKYFMYNMYLYSVTLNERVIEIKKHQSLDDELKCSWITLQMLYLLIGN